MATSTYEDILKNVVLGLLTNRNLDELLEISSAHGKS